MLGNMAISFHTCQPSLFRRDCTDFDFYVPLSSFTNPLSRFYRPSGRFWAGRPASRCKISRFTALLSRFQSRFYGTGVGLGRLCSKFHPLFYSYILIYSPIMLSKLTHYAFKCTTMLNYAYQIKKITLHSQYSLRAWAWLKARITRFTTL